MSQVAGFSWGSEEFKETEAKTEGKSLPVEILKHCCPLHPDLCWKKRNVGPPENAGGLITLDHHVCVVLKSG